MRIVLLFILSIFFLNATAQSKQDTLNTIELKAREYIDQMYTQQNFDSGSVKWNEYVFLAIEEIYKKKGFALSGKIAVLKKVKEEYTKFYASNKNFVLLKFDYKNISDESKQPTINFKYSYQEKINGTVFSGSSYLYFIFDKQLSEWKIWDFRISDVIGDSEAWLK